MVRAQRCLRSGKTHVLLVPSGEMLVVKVSLLLPPFNFRFKRSSTSSSSLKEFFPYRSFHQARYCRGKAEKGSLGVSQVKNWQLWQNERVGKCFTLREDSDRGVSKGGFQSWWFRQCNVMGSAWFNWHPYQIVWPFLTPLLTHLDQISKIRSLHRPICVTLWISDKHTNNTCSLYRGQHHRWLWSVFHYFICYCRIFCPSFDCACSEQC